MLKVRISTKSIQSLKFHELMAVEDVKTGRVYRVQRVIKDELGGIKYYQLKEYPTRVFPAKAFEVVIEKATEKVEERAG